MNPLNAFSLEGRVAVVTGSSDGIGRSIARAMAEAGAGVVITARGRERLDEAQREIEATGANVLAVPADVSLPDNVSRLMESAREHFGRVDILVNNAGGSFGATFSRGPLLLRTAADFDGCMAANVRSAFLCSVAIAPHMIERGSGVILNMSSISGRDLEAPMGGMALYSAAKAAIVNLTTSMAAEWDPQIRVNVLTPGLIDTPRTAADRPDEARARITETIALRRIGLPEDVAGAAVFLASDAAAWISGVSLDIHGGRRRPGQPLT